jgi:hypothetical protein
MCALTASLLAWPLLASTIFPWEEEEPKPGAPTSVIASCIHRGHVYAVTARKEKAFPVDDFFYLLQRRKLAAVPPDRMEELRIYLQGAYLFHISGDTFFGTCGLIDHRARLSSLRLSHLDLSGKAPALNRVWIGLSIAPMQRLAIRYGKGWGINPDFSATKDAHFAFTIGRDSKLLVFLAWKGLLSLWSGKLPRVPEKDGLDLPRIHWDNWVQKHEEESPDPKPFRQLSTQIQKPFFASQDRTDYLFVTESGQVHCLPRQGMLKKTECIWKDARRPVRLLLEDNATGTTWAFAPRKDPRDKDLADVYFSLGSIITPIAYDPAGLPKWNLRKPLEMATAHARFLVKQKKVEETLERPGPAQKK